MIQNTAKSFFSEDEQQSISNAIKLAELDTSGEIRVHIESTCPGDTLDRAAHVFSKLNMDKTNERNGVLIYLAVKNKKFAIIGDEKINEQVPEQYWEIAKVRLLNEFRNNNFASGLISIITEIGRTLKKIFPYKTDDVNELPDQISFEEEITKSAVNV